MRFSGPSKGGKVVFQPPLGLVESHQFSTALEDHPRTRKWSITMFSFGLQDLGLPTPSKWPFLAYKWGVILVTYYPP